MIQKLMLITGTRKGIGKSLVEHYVKNGYYVVGCSRKKADYKLENYSHLIADVANENEVRKVFSFIRENFGKLDVLINNAGIASMNHIMLTPLSTVNNILNTNVIGTFLFCREAAKLMAKNKFGRIVNFTTVATPLKLEGEAIYAASKAAVHSFTEVSARELAPLNITVNSVGPTPVDTDLIKSVPEDKMQRLINRQAIPRKGTVEDIINVIDFFISNKSDFITGQNLFLGGVC
ncbi:MAG: SDR family oxidoreductase [Burkholderiales bacterium]|nr:SDR family oxidoreductase [Burkholderiales bacterium]